MKDFYSWLEDERLDKTPALSEPGMTQLDLDKKDSGMSEITKSFEEIIDICQRTLKNSRERESNKENKQDKEDVESNVVRPQADAPSNPMSAGQ